MQKLFHRHMKRWCLFVLIGFFSLNGFAEEKTSENASNEFNAMEMIMHHISDMHSWPLISYHKDGVKHEICIPLPIILIHKSNLFLFWSSDFAHGEKVVLNKDTYFKLYHEKIYISDASGALEINAENHPTNIKPFDISITRNVITLWLSAALLLLLFISIAKKYRHEMQKPSGAQSVMEPIVMFVRDDIARDLLGKEKAEKYLPLLLTFFFFIWINNLLGLVPFFPGGSNLTGNIAFTMVLALLTLVVTLASGNKTYWTHIFAPPGVPGWVRIILVPVELIGIFTKPFALMIRLFANITAGHIIILSLISMIFILKSIAFAPVTIVLVIIMSILELLVGLLQAFIFTLLSALFIGLTTNNEDH